MYSIQIFVLHMHWCMCTGIWGCADTKYAICQHFQHAHLLGLASTGHFMSTHLHHIQSKLTYIYTYTYIHRNMYYTYIYICIHNMQMLVLLGLRLVDVFFAHSCIHNVQIFVLVGFRLVGVSLADWLSSHRWNME